MARVVVTGIILLLFAIAAPSPAGACSCDWKGPFLTVARDASLVVRGRVLRHHPGATPTMDVLVLEALAGALLDTGLVVQMGDGMHCRPRAGSFPAGSEWILALNGPGSKPGDGLALSHCGEYWLRVENDVVTGRIDGGEGQTKEMPLRQFRNTFLYPRFSERFAGRVTEGKTFRRPFGLRFEFILEPVRAGWEVVIREYGRSENLARLTPPLHFAPNPREIEGWHLSGDPSACPSRPYMADAGPSHPRQFIFSPEVGRRIDGPGAGRSVTSEEVEEIRLFGRGTLTIDEWEIEKGEGGCPKIERMTFSVHCEGGY